jgi:hypothetical protein
MASQSVPELLQLFWKTLSADRAECIGVASLSVRGDRIAPPQGLADRFGFRGCAIGAGSLRLTQKIPCGFRLKCVEATITLLTLTDRAATPSIHDSSGEVVVERMFGLEAASTRN